MPLAANIAVSGNNLNISNLNNDNNPGTSNNDTPTALSMTNVAFVNSSNTSSQQIISTNVIGESTNIDDTMPPPLEPIDEVAQKNDEAENHPFFKLWNFTIVPFAAKVAFLENEIMVVKNQHTSTVQAMESKILQLTEENTKMKEEVKELGRRLLQAQEQTEKKTLAQQRQMEKNIKEQLREFLNHKQKEGVVRVSMKK